MGRYRTVDGVEFVFSECLTCGVTYCVPKTMYDNQHQKGGFHTCPSGHSQGWSKQESELEKLRRERDRAQQRIAEVEDEKREAVARAEAKTKKLEREHKRMKKREAAGTCPCCQRTFSNMSTHMKREHPDFVRDTGANVVEMKKAAK